MQIPGEATIARLADDLIAGRVTSLALVEHGLQQIAADPRPVTTVYAERALAQAHKLMEQDHVLAIIGPSSTAETLACVDLADAAKIPLLSLSASAVIVRPLRPWVLSTLICEKPVALIISPSATPKLSRPFTFWHAPKEFCPPSKAPWS